MAGRARSKKPASKKKSRKTTSSPARKKSTARARTTARPKKAATKAAAKKKTATARGPKSAAKPSSRKPKKKSALAKKKATARPAKRASRAQHAKRAATRARGSSLEARVETGAEIAPASSPTTQAAAPLASPSERVLAACAELPTERSLTDDEREAMGKVCETARRFVGADGAPPAVVESIAAFVDDVRNGRREEPKSQDVRLGLGVLWGEQLRAQVGWRWVHLTYPDGFASYALVPDDRAFACFPLNRLPEALRPGSTSNRSAHVFDSIRQGTLPTRKPNAYLVIG